MLSVLEFENFYSFREKQVVDLRAGKGADDPDNRLGEIFPSSQDRVPKVVALFGPNASGKTSVLRALSFLAWFAKDSFQLSPERALPFERFNDDASADRNTVLAAEFGGVEDITKEVSTENPAGTLRYELELRHSRGKRSVVAGENLRFRPGDTGKFRRVFQRSADGSVAAAPSFGLGPLREIRMRENVSVVSTLAHLSHSFSLKFRQALSSVLSNVLIDKVEAKDEDVIRFYADTPQVVESLNRYMSRIDLGIRAMRFEQQKDGPVVVFDHAGLQTPMPWYLESHGTRSFICSFPLINHALATGGAAIVDELDASIHPLMLP
jgi:uncharacterized protein